MSNLPMWAVGAEDHTDIEPNLRYQGKLCSVSEHPIPQTTRKLFPSFQELNKAVLTGTSFVGTLLQAALIGKAWLSSGEQQAEEGLTPEQRVPSEEHARSHDVPWKEQGLYFSFRF